LLVAVDPAGRPSFLSTAVKAGMDLKVIGRLVQKTTVLISC
jgi:hypothetical protein